MSAAVWRHFGGGGALEVGARHGIQLERKFVALETRQGVREMIDGVIRHRQRAVAAGIGYLQLKIGVELFGGVHRDDHGLAVAGVDAAAIGIENVLGVDQIAMILQQPIDAIGFAAFFVGGEREDDVAIRPVIFLLEANQRGDEDGVAAFHVLRAAAVEVAVLLDEFEGVDGPVFAAGFDHVQVPDEEDGLLRAGAAKARDHVAFALVGAEHVHVGGGEARVAQALGHRFGGHGGAA